MISKNVMDQGTICLYICVILSAVIVAFMSYKKGYANADNGETINCQPRISKPGMIITFLILWLLLAFSNCGTDTPMYNDLFLNALNWNYCIGYHQIEVGFAVLNTVIRIFTKSTEVYNAIISFLFLIFTFGSLWRLKNDVHFGWAILAFTTTFYLQFMDLKRIYLAASIVLFALTFLLRKENVKYAFWILIATLIHMSAVLMFVPLLVQEYISKKCKTWKLVAISMALLVFIYIFRNQIFSIVLFDRYSNYGVVDGSFGVMQLIYHLPIFWLIAKYGDLKQNYFHKLCLVLTCMSFVLSSIGYFVVIISRVFVFFELAFMGAASITNTHQIGKKRSFGVIKTRDIVNAVVFLYFGFRLYMYCNEYLFLDGIMPYVSIFDK